MGITKRSWDSNSFQVDVVVNGRRHRKSFKKRSEAVLYEKELLDTSKHGTYLAEGLKATVAEAAKIYQGHIEERHQRGKRMTRHTLAVQTGHLKNYIIGGRGFERRGQHVLFDEGLGGKKLGQLDEDCIESFLEAVGDFGNSHKTVKEVRGTLVSMLNFAKRKRLVGVNIAKSVTLIAPRNGGQKREITVPDKRLINAMIDAATEDFRLYLMFASLTGVRAGEQRALRWQHINWLEEEVLIRTRVDAYGDEDGQGPKTRAGNRNISLSKVLVEALRGHRQSTKYSKDGDLVFVNGNGRYIEHNHMKEYRYVPAYAKAIQTLGVASMKMPMPRWHDLRHFAVSCWIEAGFSHKAIQTFAGHKNLSTTMDVYGHLFRSKDHTRLMDRIAADLLGSDKLPDVPADSAAQDGHTPPEES